MMSAPSIATKRVSTVSPRCSRSLIARFEAVIDLAAEQVLELLAVARRIGGDDHLVGGAGAGQEMLGIEALVLARDRVEAGGDRRARLGDALPAIGGGSTGSAGFGAGSGARPGSATTLSRGLAGRIVAGADE